MTQPNPEPTYSVQQVCDILSVSRRTVYNWMDAGKVQFVRTPGGARRILRSSLYQAGSVEPSALEAGR